MNLLPFPYVPLSKRCTECGEWKMSAELEDGWCSRCRGVQAPPVLVVTPPSEPLTKDWTVMDCPSPGVSGIPYDMEQAEEAARYFGGRVVPLAYYREQTKSKPKGRVFPHYGENHRGEM